MAQAGMAAIPGLKDTYIQLKTRMDKAVEDFRKAMAATRTGRANVHMVDAVSVDYYGSQMPLNQIAQVHAPEPQLITIQPFDPTALAAIEKAIRSADLGLNPMNDGKIVRVPVPALTEERRKDMVKHLHKVLEEHRTAGVVARELDAAGVRPILSGAHLAPAARWATWWAPTKESNSRWI